MQAAPDRVTLLIIMLVTASANLPLGWFAPDFELVDAYHHPFKLTQFESFPGLLIIFINQASSLAKYVWPAINQLHENFKRQVAFIAINSLANDEDRLENLASMQKTIEEYQIGFPYLADNHSRISTLYQVQCLPDFYLFKNEGGHNFCLQYHGRLNDNYDHPELVIDEGLKQALARQRSNLTPLLYQKPAVGEPLFTS